MELLKPAFVVSNRRVIDSLSIPLFLVMAFWAVALLDKLIPLDLHLLGILPRHLMGVAGIVASPFLHGGFSHLFSNSVSFLVLLTFIRYFYPNAAQSVFWIIYLGTGLGVWIVARNANISQYGVQPVYHIGASGLIYGFATFIFFSGIFRKDRSSWALSAIVALLYNGMLYGVVPNQPGISWESHAVGAFVGFMVAYQFRRHDLPAIKDVPLPEGWGYRNIETPVFKYFIKK